jgi:hypothetical protein
MKPVSLFAAECHGRHVEFRENLFTGAEDADTKMISYSSAYES